MKTFPELIIMRSACSPKLNRVENNKGAFTSSLKIIKIWCYRLNEKKQLFSLITGV
jgi:hypothetical protein